MIRLSAWKEEAHNPYRIEKINHSTESTTDKTIRKTTPFQGNRIKIFPESTAKMH